jgi:adenylyl-sulfate kinase
MSLLELLYRAHAAVTAVEATFSDWSHPMPSHELVVDANGSGGKLRWRGPGPWPHPRQTTRRIWAHASGKLRVEISHDGDLIRLGVRDCERWYRWDEVDGVSCGGLYDGGAIPPLLDPAALAPARLIGSLRFEPVGAGERIGRRVVLVRAWPRSQRRDSEVAFELEFDCEHGTLLRRAMFQDGHLVHVTEALAVSYNTPIDPVRFVVQEPEQQEHGQSAGIPDVLRTPGSARTNGDVRPRPSRRPAVTLWLTGLSGAGKTTLAHAIERQLLSLDRPVCVLDGDELRKGLSSDLGLSRRDRSEQARRTAEMAALMAQSGVVAVVALVSPYASDRARARDIHERLGLRFIEIWVETPLEVCEQRDSKGLYAAARAGELSQLTGIDAPYEPPATPELRVPGVQAEPEHVAGQILELLESSAQAAATAGEAPSAT